MVTITALFVLQVIPPFCLPTAPLHSDLFGQEHKKKNCPESGGLYFSLLKHNISILNFPIFTSKFGQQ